MRRNLRTGATSVAGTSTPPNGPPESAAARSSPDQAPRLLLCHQVKGEITFAVAKPLKILSGKENL